jgi:DNA-binding MarR family transcriptional regulator
LGVTSGEQVKQRLGYLLKHALLHFQRLSTEAMAPFDVGGKQLAVLQTIESPLPQSQQDVARALGVDRTTMVLILDELERKRLIHRFVSPHDRRKNVVVVTPSGMDAIAQAGRAAEEAERQFLAGLSESDVATLRRLLSTLVAKD